jgi:phytoene synthase
MRIDLNSTYEVFRKYYKGSKRYFVSSLYFPNQYRIQVATVYNFCRLVDDTVDEPDKVDINFDELKDIYAKSLSGERSNNSIIDIFIDIKNESDIKDEWVQALFNSMQMDIDEVKYTSLDDTLKYAYGVAEVVGLMMCKVLKIPEEAFPFAKLLGRSAQWINFIRDIGEDVRNNRSYFPNTELAKFGLNSLKYEDILKNEDGFKEFIRFQSQRYYEWTAEAEKGYKYIPGKVLKPILYSTEIDKWKMKEILSNPLSVYDKKINPSLSRMFVEIMKTRIRTSKTVKRLPVYRLRNIVR